MTISLIIFFVKLVCFSELEIDRKLYFAVNKDKRLNICLESKTLLAKK